MVNVALTGGIGSGKTLISKVFKILGVPIYYSDKEAKLLYYLPQVKSQVIELLGPEAYHNNGTKINKQFIGDKIFNDKELLNKVNAVFHPQIRQHYDNWAMSQGKPIVMQETALIFESQQQHRFDKTILVTAPEPIRLKRAMSRDNATEIQIKNRMSNQMSDEEKIEHADYRIINDGTTKIIPQIISLYHKLQSLDTSKD